MAPVVSLAAGDHSTASVVTMSPTIPQRSVPPDLGCAVAAADVTAVVAPGNAVGTLVAFGAAGAGAPHAASSEPALTATRSSRTARLEYTRIYIALPLPQFL